MKILYIGSNEFGTTSLHRADALKRLGNYVKIVNPKMACLDQLNNKIFSIIHYRTGYKFIQAKVKKYLIEQLKENINFDLIWVNGGELLGIESLKYLRKLNIPILLYNNDDPTGGRDGNRFNTLIKAIPYYDLCVVMREVNVLEYRKLGAKKVIRVTMSYDEIEHAPIKDIFCNIPKEFQSDVAFIGTWMRNEKRDEFLVKLIESGISISIWGQRWGKSSLWGKLRPFYRGKELKGSDYVKAIQGAKICLGFLSKGNRDLYTTRSFEIPYAGGLLCAERTTEHLSFYKENEEAFFWSDVDECIKICKRLLANGKLREKVKEAGMEKVRKLKVGNEDICVQILIAVQKLS